MKIVFIDQDVDVMGGVERIISTLANNFCIENDVTVISKHKNRDVPFFKYDKRVNVIYLKDNRKNSLFSRNKNNFFNKINDFLSYKLRRLIVLYITKEVKEIINSADCIIFGRVDVYLDFASYLKNNSINKKIIVRDAINLKTFDKKTRNEMLKYFPEMVSDFIVSSDESIKLYKQFFPENIKTKIHKIFNPIGIVPKGKFDFSSNTVVSLGRFDIQKGYEDLVLAFQIVLKKFPNWRLKIYGTGPLKQKILDLIFKLNLNENIEVCDSTNDVVSIFNSSSIYVMTSRYEGYANTLVEAMACGMPVISYDWYTGVEDIIDNNINGEIVNLNDRDRYFFNEDNNENVENLAIKIMDFISNPSKCNIYSKEAKKIILTRSSDIIIDCWKKIINERRND